MSQINIITAQNVLLKIELANIGDRFLAALLDILVKIGITVGISTLLVALNNDFFAFLALFVLLVTWMFYSLVFEYFLKGQTPGKKIMQVKVAMLDGSPVSFGSLTLRWLLRLVDFLFYTSPGIGIFAIIITEKHQRIGDMAAGTIVVSTKERTSLGETFYKETTAGYVPTFVTADRLTAREAEIIQEVFFQYRKNEKYELITLAATKVKELLQVDTGLDDLTFLKTVLKDYNVTAANEGTPFESRESFTYSL